jgi:hypothetical protein
LERIQECTSSLRKSSKSRSNKPRNCEVPPLLGILGALNVFFFFRVYLDENLPLRRQQEQANSAGGSDAFSDPAEEAFNTSDFGSNAGGSGSTRQQPQHQPRNTVELFKQKLEQERELLEQRRREHGVGIPGKCSHATVRICAYSRYSGDRPPAPTS